MKKQPDIVRLADLVAKLLELEPKEVKEKLSSFDKELVEIIGSNRRFIIPGVLEIRPEYLEPGRFLNTNLKEFVDVPARISPRVKVQKRFSLAIKELRLKLINYF